MIGLKTVALEYDVGATKSQEVMLEIFPLHSACFDLKQRHLFETESGAESPSPGGADSVKSSVERLASLNFLCCKKHHDLFHASYDLHQTLDERITSSVVGHASASSSAPRAFRASNSSSQLPQSANIFSRHACFYYNW